MKRPIYLLLAALLACFQAQAQDFSLSHIVIDPGHGGNDPGAISRDGKSQEKALTLDIAKRVATKIKAECPGVKVTMTRSTDKSVALNDRAAIANDAGAGLFMSIHINSAKNTSANGFSVHVLGKSSNKNRDLFAYNMDVCKRENTVILLEDDYTTTYQGFDPSDPESFIFLQLMQNANLEQSLEFAEYVSESLKGGPIKANRGIWQDPFLVLWRTAMPAVLIELGFISNSSDLSLLRSEESRDKLAACICKAFKKYKADYDGTMFIDSETSGKDSTKTKPAAVQEKPAAAQQEVPAEAPAATETLYGVQIFVGSKKLPENDKSFLGYKPMVVKTDKYYKYVIGLESTPEEAKKNLPEIRKKYSDAFLVKIEDGKISMLK